MWAELEHNLDDIRLLGTQEERGLKPMSASWLNYERITDLQANTAQWKLVWSYAPFPSL
jgi:hypothetical protein